jgi:hypothetical protein
MPAATPTHEINDRSWFCKSWEVLRPSFANSIKQPQGAKLSEVCQDIVNFWFKLIEGIFRSLNVIYFMDTFRLNSRSKTLIKGNPQKKEHIKLDCDWFINILITWENKKKTAYFVVSSTRWRHRSSVCRHCHLTTGKIVPKNFSCSQRCWLVLRQRYSLSSSEKSMNDSIAFQTTSVDHVILLTLIDLRHLFDSDQCQLNLSSRRSSLTTGYQQSPEEWHDGVESKTRQQS